MAIKLASDATITKRNIVNRLESSKLAILRISFGCADKMVIQSKIMILKAIAIQVINVTAGTDGTCLIKKKVTAPISNERYNL